MTVTHYIALIEDRGPNAAVGVLFPDLPGCYSAGETVEEAITNAAEALSLHMEGLADIGACVPPPRTVEAIRTDPAFAGGFGSWIVVPVPFVESVPAAAE